MILKQWVHIDQTIQFSMMYKHNVNISLAQNDSRNSFFLVRKEI